MKTKYKYIPPKEVKSPKEFVELLEVIHDGKEEGYSIAKIKWDGKECIGIRWNITMREWNDEEKKKGNKICLGMPSYFGHSVWFILPGDLLKKNSEIWKKIEKANIYINKK